MITNIRVGLMADSHGDAAAIKRALQFFGEQECTLIFHLGDICDSNYPEDAHVCATLLQENAVRAVMGNNDHIMGQYRGQVTTPMKLTREYYNQLPMTEEFSGAILAHSLPWYERLGRSCLTRKLGKTEARFFLRGNTHRILFRGHSHTPEIIWAENKTILARILETDQLVSIESRWPCIVTCGALLNGYCLIWKPLEETIVCHQLG